MQLQEPLFKPEATWRPKKVPDHPSWKGAGRIAIDVETKDDHLKTMGCGVRRGGYVVGVSYAIEDGPSGYLPFRHAGGDNLPAEHVIQYLKDQAEVFTGDLCGANLQYDLDYLAELGIVFRRVKWFRDCQVAEPLLDELQRSYSLDNIAKRRGIPGKDEELLRDAAELYGIDPKAELWRLPARYVGGYAIQDVRLPLQLLRRQEREIDEQDLWKVYNLESKVLPVLVKMRRRGVKIDFDKLDQVEKWSLTESKKYLDEVNDLTFIRIEPEDVMKPGAVAPALQSIGVTIPRTPKTKQYSIDAAFLKSINHPVAEAIIRARKIGKLRTTFAKSVRKHAIGDRIHCTFNQLRRADDSDGDGEGQGARYGRLSCTKPNLQQQPSRDWFADLWRSIYIPDDQSLLWACNDFSQQEPKWLVHFAELTKIKGQKFPGAFEAGELYRNDPNTDNHTMMARIVYGYGPDEEPTKQERTNAKIIFLGLCYGMGGAKLAHDLGLPTKWIENRKGRKIEVAGDAAQMILNQFNRRAPFVKKMAEACERKAAREGYITTLAGRRCRFPKKHDGSYDWVYKALNRLIQGSSGDQVKYAMVAVDDAGYKTQLQVHDELDQGVEHWKQAKEIATIMRECVTARIPFKVDTECGPSWGEILKEDKWLEKYSVNS